MALKTVFNPFTGRFDMIQDVAVIDTTVTFNFGNEENKAEATVTNSLFNNTILSTSILPVDDDGTTFASFDDWVNNGVNANVISISGSDINLGAIANNNASGNYKAILKTTIKL
jgi:hypothetical protein